MSRESLIEPRDLLHKRLPDGSGPIRSLTIAGGSVYFLDDARRVLDEWATDDARLREVAARRVLAIDEPERRRESPDA